MTKKVLVADDSLTIQKFICLALADEDISVECIADGEQAVEKIKSLQPHLVLVDVQMPSVNGYEICSSVKNDPALADTRVVLMVGTFESFDEEAAARVKCDGHLTKPFDTSELIQLAHSMMPYQGAQTEAREAGSALEMRMSSNTSDASGLQTIPTLISSKTKESFMGSGRILELFSEEHSSTLKAADSPVLDPQIESTLGAAEMRAAETGQTEFQTKIVEEAVPLPVQENIQALTELPDEVLDKIVEKVVRRISQEVVREIAWEVVPELSDVIIRQRLEELERKS
jgi:CheY-like chemotaxis protein